MVFRYRVKHVLSRRMSWYICDNFFSTKNDTVEIINKSIDSCITSIVQKGWSIDTGSRHASHYIAMCRTVVFVEKYGGVGISFVFFLDNFRKQEFYIGFLLVT